MEFIGNYKNPFYLVNGTRCALSHTDEFQITVKPQSVIASLDGLVVTGTKIPVVAVSNCGETAYRLLLDDKPDSSLLPHISTICLPTKQITGERVFWSPVAKEVYTLVTRDTLLLSVPYVSMSTGYGTPTTYSFNDEGELMQAALSVNHIDIQIIKYVTEGDYITLLNSTISYWFP